MTIPPNQQYARLVVKGLHCNGIIEETKKGEIPGKKIS
jgi:hypothetical protein